MTIDTYPDKVIPYLRILINEKKITDQKIQLDIGINLRHIIEDNRITFYVKTANIMCLPSHNTDDILEQLISSFYNQYKNKLLLCRTSSSFVYESAEGSGIQFHKIELNRGSSYIPSLDWLKNKGATINPQNTKDNYCFMYAVTFALYHKETGHNPERISKRPIEHIPKYNWDKIDFPASIPDYKIVEKNNTDIALNILYVPHNKEKIRPEYISQHNFTRKKQITLLKITDNKGTWHFLALKSIPTEDGYVRPTKAFSRLMEGKSSNSQLPEKGKNYKLQFGTKSLRMYDIIYLDLEWLLLKYYTCSNNPYQSSTEKVAYHEVCGYSTNIKRNHSKESINTHQRGKNSLSILCKKLKEHVLMLIKTEKKPLIPLANEEEGTHIKSNHSHICHRKFIEDEDHQYYQKLRKVIDHDHYTGKYRVAAHSICNLRYETQKDIPVVTHNGSNYDFHLLITELAKEFRSNMRCIPEDKQKCISISIPIIIKREDDKFTRYNLKFIDSAKFMAGSLDTHVNNLSELYNCRREDKKKQSVKVKCKKRCSTYSL